jgi:hypothetical protein
VVLTLETVQVVPVGSYGLVLYCELALLSSILHGYGSVRVVWTPSARTMAVEQVTGPSSGHSVGEASVATDEAAAAVVRAATAVVGEPRTRVACGRAETASAQRAGAAIETFQFEAGFVSTECPGCVDSMEVVWRGKHLHCPVLGRKMAVELFWLE